jgi:hypothetical protein
MQDTITFNIESKSPGAIVGSGKAPGLDTATGEASFSSRLNEQLSNAEVSGSEQKATKVTTNVQIEKAEKAALKEGKDLPQKNRS